MWTPENPFFGSPRRRPKGRAVASPNPAVAEMLVRGEDFENKPWHGASSGEMLPANPELPPPAGLTRPAVPAPEWTTDDETKDLGAHEHTTNHPPPAPSALEQMRADAGDFEEPRAPGPLMVTVPIEAVRPRIPEVDWRAEEDERKTVEREERKRAARERRAELLRELLAEGENETAYPKGKRP